ncbi:hypothetical protein FA15DRAFT_380284 [Coprinopsis marcescibilis]|uniref:Uncharacterized protein n=1 Tax=Coprinopsis marcescibilis TaxID=230819 RepID=A0A5C3KAB8_COPMA|nr:hypothetical protein FA15DRAFT_380284 [Coprinopsis marcescibilis]
MSKRSNRDNVVVPVGDVSDAPYTPSHLAATRTHMAAQPEQHQTRHGRVSLIELGQFLPPGLPRHPLLPSSTFVPNPGPFLSSTSVSNTPASPY